MNIDSPDVYQVAHFKLEKFDDETGELLEVIEGGDGLETVVTYRKEEQNGNDEHCA